MQMGVGVLPTRHLAPCQTWRLPYKEDSLYSGGAEVAIKRLFTCRL